MRHQLLETVPVETATLASPIQPLPQKLHDLSVKFFEATVISAHSVVVVVPSELHPHLLKELT